MQVLFLGRAPRTEETLPDFLKWRRVTRPPLVFRGLTGSQRTPGFWGVTKENSVFVRGVWVPYGAETINAMYGMEGQKHGSKYKKLADSPNREKIARKLTDGKVKWGQGGGEKKIINRGDLTEEAQVWFYFLASILVPTKHVCTVRE